jgi:hypothetical protein
LVVGDDGSARRIRPTARDGDPWAGGVADELWVNALAVAGVDGGRRRPRALR